MKRKIRLTERQLRRIITEAINETSALTRHNATQAMRNREGMDSERFRNTIYTARDLSKRDDFPGDPHGAHFTFGTFDRFSDKSGARWPEVKFTGDDGHEYILASGGSVVFCLDDKSMEPLPMKEYPQWKYGDARDIAKQYVPKVKELMQQFQETQPRVPTIKDYCANGRVKGITPGAKDLLNFYREKRRQPRPGELGPDADFSGILRENKYKRPRY